MNEPNTFTERLKIFFTLRPYGYDLLTPSARQWLLASWMIIFIMAAVEMVAWGYVGSLMSESYPWVTAVGAGLAVFLIVWIVDSSLIG